MMKSNNEVSNAFKGNFVQPVVMMDENGKPIPMTPTEKKALKKYLLLVYIDDDEDDERTFDVVVGRYNTANMIMNEYRNRYDFCVNPFTSTVISDSVLIEQGISFYSFIRMCITKELLTETEWKNVNLQINPDEDDDDTIEIFTLDSFNAFIADTYSYLIDELDVEGEDEIEKLDNFYKQDIGEED